MVARTPSSQGFTLIELLIAVLIIGILAAIALPALNGARDRAKDQEAKQQLEYGLRAAKAVYADGESFPASGLAVLLGRAERSVSFAEASSFPAAGTVNVERSAASTLVLRASSRTGNQYLLAIDEQASRVVRSGSTGGAGLSPHTNLSYNPSLETSTTRWGRAPSVSTFVRVNDWAASGSWSLRAQGTATSDTYVNLGARENVAAEDVMPVSANQRYTACYTARVDVAPSLGISARIIFFNQLTQPLTANNVSDTRGSPVTGSGERRVCYSAVAPASAVGAIVRAQMEGSGSNFDVYLDAVSFYAGNATGFFDGSFPAATWSGTPHESASVGYPNHNW